MSESNNRAAKKLYDAKNAEQTAKVEDHNKQEAADRVVQDNRDRQNTIARMTVSDGAKKMKGTKGTVETTLSDGAKKTVVATIYGELAVHRANLDTPTKGEWTVSHVKTGLRLGSNTFPTKGQAIEATWLMQQGIDWNFSDSSKPPKNIKEAHDRMVWYSVRKGGEEIPRFLTEENCRQPSAASASAKPDAGTGLRKDDYGARSDLPMNGNNDNAG